MAERFQAATDFCRDHEAAVKYLQARPEFTLDAGTVMSQFMRNLEWKYRTENTIMANVYGCTLVHELAPAALNCFPIWGELFYNDPKMDTELFDSLECFVAFAVARWW